MHRFLVLMATVVSLASSGLADAPKRGVVCSDPQPVRPVQPIVVPANPDGPPKVILGVGELARLSAKPDGSTDIDGVAYLWMVPTGLNHKTDSNQRDLYVSSAEKGSYTVVVLMARNGEKRPELWKAEIIVQVGEAKPNEPVRPNDDLAAARAMYPVLIENIRKLEIEVSVRKPLAEAYTTLATRIGDGTLKDIDAIRREVNSQLGTPDLTSAAGQKAILAMSAAVANSVKDAESLQPAQYKLMFLAIADAIRR
jgi:hypothetical protein